MYFPRYSYSAWLVGAQGLRKNSRSHIDASHSRQPLVKGERLVRYEVNAVMLTTSFKCHHFATHTAMASYFTQRLDIPLCWLMRIWWLLGRSPHKIARMTLTVKLDRNWSSFQLANSAPPLSVTDSAIAPSARIVV